MSMWKSVITNTKQKAVDVIGMAVLVSLAIVISSALDNEIWLEQVKYRTYGMAYVTGSLGIMSWIALSLLFVWPEDKYKFLRKWYGLMSYKSIKYVEKSFLLVAAILVAVSILGISITFLSDKNNTYFLAFALGSAVFAVLFMNLKFVRLKIFPLRPSKEILPYQYLIFACLLCAYLIFANLLADTRNIVVQLPKDQIDNILTIKPHSINYQKWIEEAINEKLERTENNEVRK